MLHKLEQHFPAEATWTVPDGGLFLWVSLPEGAPVAAICNEASLHKVMVTSGSSFFPNQQGYPAMRLNFSQTLEDIEQGISLLGNIIKQHLPQTRSHASNA
jgi:DNA-binding transcriptional MocR family regulator